MSLNGLDAGAIREAHQAALAEPGGWFLLKYVSRDTVDLFSHGNGGIQEAKNAVDQYGELSPLYGLAQYRRKRVVLKYVPEGTSRLLKVRLTVQFQSILDAFPHDTVFTFAAAGELVESALGLSAMLQPTRNESLASSTSSMKHRRLNEISEDAEDSNTAATQAAQAPSSVVPHDRRTPELSSRKRISDGLPESAKRAKALLAKRREAEAEAAATGALYSELTTAATPPRSLPAPSSYSTISSNSTPTPTPLPAPVTAPPPPPPAPPAPVPVPVSVPDTVQVPDLQPPPRSQARPRLNPLRLNTVTTPYNPPVLIAKPAFDKSLPATPVPTPTPNTTTEAPAVSFTSEHHAPTPELLSDHSRPYSPEELLRSLPPSRHLTENESKNISQWSEAVSSYVPPVPKPKKKLGPRPHVEAGPRPKTSTNVANMPQTVRTSTRAASALSIARPGSQQSSRSVPARFAATEMSLPPPMPSSSHVAEILKNTRPSKPPSIASAVMSETSGSAAPEKLRLMKALQMRKRNMILAQRAASVQSGRSQSTQQDDDVPRKPHSHNPSLAHSTSTAINEPVSRIIEEVNSEKTLSSTASPTTAETASEKASTKPSSFASEKRRSVSLDTASSSTPKGDPEQSQPSSVKQSSDYATRSGLDRGEIASRSTRLNPIEETSKLALGGHTTSGIDSQSEQYEASVDQSADLDEKTDLAAPPKPASQRTITAPAATGKVTPVAAQSDQAKGSRGQVELRVPEIPSSPRRESNRSEASASTGFGKPSLHGSIQIPGSGDASEFSEDDVFAEELRNATVQEARSVSVSKSPVTPVQQYSVDKARDFKQNGTSDVLLRTRTAISEPDRSRSMSLRSASATNAMSHWPPVNSNGEPAPLTKKGTLGQSISRRIKALEVLTHKEASAPAPPSPRSPRDSFASRIANRTSFLAPLRSEQFAHLKDPVPSPRSYISSPEHPNRANTHRAGGTTEVFSSSKKGETISVTARIVRDGGRPSTSASQTINDRSHQMHRSPLIVAHESDLGSNRPPIPRGLSDHSLNKHFRSPSDRRRPSFSSYKSGSTVKGQQSDARSGRISILSSYRKHGKKDSEASSVATEKSSRTAKLMKRVSGFGHRVSNIGKLMSPSKDTGVYAETIQEGTESPVRRDSSSASIMQVIDIGDVNVQFPETLLWKRRFMRIDDQGYLIFTSASDNAHIRTQHRRFHLSDLKVPTLPDTEREEMSWSILLDLRDGRSIQCACESKSAQRQILQMLLDAHDAYNSLYTN